MGTESFLVGGQKICEKNQAHVLRNTTLKNVQYVFFKKMYIWCTKNGVWGKAPEAGEFSRICVLKVTLQTLTVSYRQESGKQDVLPNFWGEQLLLCPTVPVPMFTS